MVSLPDEGRIQNYLSDLWGGPVRVLSVSPIGTDPAAGALKGYGYGVPLLIEYEREGQSGRVVLETMAPTPFGHEHMEDRAQIMLFEHRAFNRLPRHVRSLDVGGFQRDGSLASLARLEEPFILMEYVEGSAYVSDLERIRDTGELAPLDVDRCDALCDYLVGIHAARRDQPSLYVRRIRELLGHGECIMGLVDSYPTQHGFLDTALLEDLERLCVSWRFRLKSRTHRLRAVHGDFHPWNLLFRSGADFTALDRSRGEWGEPADDVACLSANYLFFSLQRGAGFDGPLRVLFERFWSRYLEATGDTEMLGVVAPFFAFRGLVMASPLWYPNLTEAVRRRLFSFIWNVLAEPRFVVRDAPRYCEAETWRKRSRCG